MRPHWYERAADAGESVAMFNLGLLYAQMEPPDLDAARRWWERAADAGHIGAMDNLKLLQADAPRVGWRRAAARAMQRWRR